MTKRKAIQYLREYAKEKEMLGLYSNAVIKIGRILDRTDPAPTCLPFLPGWGSPPGTELSEEGWAFWERKGRIFAEDAEDLRCYIRELEEQSPVPVCWLARADELLDALENGRAASLEEAVRLLENT